MISRLVATALKARSTAIKPIVCSKQGRTIIDGNTESFFSFFLQKVFFTSTTTISRKYEESDNNDDNERDSKVDDEHDNDDDNEPSLWPSSEHAAFAFTALAKPGRETITLEEFLDVIRNMNLQFNLSQVELERVFRHLDVNNDGQVSLEEFQAGRKTSPLTIAMVKALCGSGTEDTCEIWNKIFPPKHFDPSVSTSEFYGTPINDGFVGENVAIRELLDYKYHNNYTHQRQQFQDALIRQNVLLDGNSADRPLLVYTCGPMGVGKGYVLGWMSANGIISLERVSKIDPDTFKVRLPEWPVYTQNSLELAGTFTHKESSYIAEIASHVAMNNKMNVWVDGSLRNYKWYEKQFDYIRHHWPEYRIAILAIDASDDIIQNRLQERAEKTGRYVPKELSRESSRGIDEGLRRLIPKIDFMAHIINNSNNNNNDSSDGTNAGGPTLSAISIIDNSGNWDLIKKLTSS